MNDVATSKGRDRGLSVTIKYGKGYEQSWAVFTGSADEVREDLCAYFGVDGASVTALTLHELVINVTGIAHGTSTAAAVLGAVTLPSSTTAPASTTDEAQADPWADDPTTPAAPAENPLLAQIAATPDVKALQILWAENQAAFADEAVMAAWKARGKQLQTAA